MFYVFRQINSYETMLLHRLYYSFVCDCHTANPVAAQTTISKRPFIRCSRIVSSKIYICDSF